MSTDHYQVSATCQSCGQKKRTARTGTVQRHRNAAGSWCPGGRCLSAEARDAARTAAAAHIATQSPDGA